MTKQPIIEQDDKGEPVQRATDADVAEMMRAFPDGIRRSTRRVGRKAPKPAERRAGA